MEHYQKETEKLQPLFKSYEDSKNEAVKDPTHYYVDMSAWKLGIQIITAEEATERTAESKYEAWVDYERTVVAAPLKNKFLKSIKNK